MTTKPTGPQSGGLNEMPPIILDIWILGSQLVILIQESLGDVALLERKPWGQAWEFKDSHHFKFVLSASYLHFKMCTHSPQLQLSCLCSTIEDSCPSGKINPLPLSSVSCLVHSTFSQQQKSKWYPHCHSWDAICPPPHMHWKQLKKGCRGLRRAAFLEAAWHASAAEVGRDWQVVGSQWQWVAAEPTQRWSQHLRIPTLKGQLL